LPDSRVGSDAVVNLKPQNLGRCSPVGGDDNVDEISHVDHTFSDVVREVTGEKRTASNPAGRDYAGDRYIGDTRIKNPYESAGPFQTATIISTSDILPSARLPHWTCKCDFETKIRDGFLPPRVKIG
jgi:hypothetical protein